MSNVSLRCPFWAPKQSYACTHDFMLRRLCTGFRQEKKVPLRSSKASAIVERTGIDYAIKVCDLRVRLGPVGAQNEVIRGLNLSVQRGHLHMLLGRNGCGKSTLIRTIAGMIPAVGGEVSVDGRIGFVFQNPDHQVVMPTAGPDIALSLGGKGLTRDEVRAKVEKALADVNMEGFFDRPTHTLSGGQKQRLAVAGALAQGAQVLLLDELTTFLDEVEQDNLLQVVKDVVVREGVTAVWVTHRLEELRAADSVTLMEDGRVTLSGPLQAVRKHLRARVV